MQHGIHCFIALLILFIMRIYILLLCNNQINLVIILVFRYIGNKSSKVDQRLLQIRLPNFVARQPRSVSQRKFWKGMHNITIIMISLHKAILQLVNGNISYFFTYLPYYQKFCQINFWYMYFYSSNPFDCC